MPTDDRRYTDQEVGEILKRAVEGDPTKALTRSDSTSLAELKAIGAEVGIDPDRIEHAARSLAVRRPARVNPLLGAATDVDHEARLPGVISAEDTPEAVAKIRQIMGMLGETSEIRGTMEWRASGDMGARWVTVSPSDGHTTIRASARLGQGAALSFIPTIITTVASAIGILGGANVDGEPLAGGLLLMVVMVYATTRSLWSRFARREDDRLKEVVAELSKLVVPADGASDPT